MDKFLIFTIVGLSTAAIYAVIASGLVLTYTTTGIFNFAHGAIGMLAAFVYWQLRFEWGWPTPVALILVRAVRGRAAVRRAARAGDHARAGGHQRGDEARGLHLACSSAMIGLAKWVWQPGVSRPVKPFFGADQIDLGVDRRSPTTS